ncbi:PTS sugar transporter subunit IIB [Vibrio sp. 10N.222.54.A1]|uniref:PTS sugar transporter subunit IIB n=1 Tax=Vibrio TaxID=662 RepID=UPI000C84C8A4|nr:MULTISPECIES: PTS sugar transporter subunit IIB [Vibrio]PMK13284.1 PTS sugar transporter subunit IIB [Vibrio sp. 10N.261.54.E10]PMK82978.1 PTS sugar transporter subunit IIB [Vibrio sp. 10N.261.52.E5]TKF85790.1 PTS sugar transporter subunit IIB [Vibrio sp. F13]
MINILLCCAAGMSTSMVVNKMKQSAAAKGIEAHIEAVGLDEFESNLPNFDCVLLGPQIKYKLNDFKEIADAANKPISVMNQMDYGMMKGEKILNDAITMLNQ